MSLFKKKEKKVTTYDAKGKKVDEVPDKVPELKVPLPPRMTEEEKALSELERGNKMAEYHFKNGYEAAMKEKSQPVVEIPPPAPEPEEAVREEIENNPGEYFESARDYGFTEGISFAIATLRQAQNDIIRRQKER
jgi:hypothetical protein